MTPRIALVGDYSAEVTAHRAIPLALELAREAGGADVTWEWVHTTDVTVAPRDLAPFAAVWLVPASPYANMAGALAAVRFARETRRPFLGTCGGFQHALIEIARNVAGLHAADHGETAPGGDALVVTRLACSLVEQSETLRLVPGSLLQGAYGTATAHETYRCRYGVNPAFRAQLEAAGLQFVAFDQDGTPRAAELPLTMHPFFLGTLFQPERAALKGRLPPLVRAFVDSITRNGIHLT